MSHLISNKVTIQFGGGGEINFIVNLHAFIISILPILFFYCMYNVKSRTLIILELLSSISLMRVTWQYMYRWFRRKPICTTMTAYRVMNNCPFTCTQKYLFSSSWFPWTSHPTAAQRGSLDHSGHSVFLLKK